jgi:hypothetical protein
MTTESLSEEIVRMVYHEAVISDDPYVQEVAVQTSVQDLLEEFERDVRRGATEDEWQVREKLTLAEENIIFLEAENERNLATILSLKGEKS